MLGGSQLGQPLPSLSHRIFCQHTTHLPALGSDPLHHEQGPSAFSAPPHGDREDRVSLPNPPCYLHLPTHPFFPSSPLLPDSSFHLSFHSRIPSAAFSGALGAHNPPSAPQPPTFQCLLCFLALEVPCNLELGRILSIKVSESILVRFCVFDVQGEQESTHTDHAAEIAPAGESHPPCFPLQEAPPSKEAKDDGLIACCRWQAMHICLAQGT